MSGCNKSPKNDQQSIKYWRIQHGGVSFETDLSRVDYSPSLSNNENKQRYGSCQPKSPHILSTAQLISAIGQVCDSASQSLSVLLPKENLNQDDNGFSKEKILDNIEERKNDLVYTSNGTKFYPLTAGSAKIVRERLDFPKVMQKILAFESPDESQDYIHSLFQRFSKASDKITNKDCKKMEFAREEEMSFKSGNVYWWAGRNAIKMLNCLVNVTQPENLETNSSVAGSCISLDTSNPALANKERDVCSHDSITHQSQSLSNAAILNNTRIISPLCSDYFLQAVPDAQADVGACQKLSSSIDVDSHINCLASCTSASEQCQHDIDDNESLEVQRRHLLDITNDEPKLHTFSATHLKPCNSKAKQEHAFSGALAGVCVSLCLHPVDTIKTVIQSCRAEHRSIFYIGKSIVSDRGLFGLYRGIATNVASSAPISAVYTFSYESVKAALLPYLPKEYYSFAHCIGGGCASIATSFIFTPSERIKQQMQVRSQYRNCWYASVFGIIITFLDIELLALSWRAVLCRNVPHSIIKFYTYESLKEVMPSSVQPNTFQTLVCGGLAGSTAALFTTPFDVIKTRLQTQIPGSANQYDSVLHALYKISKGEGLKGLYRGLIPRLIMYMTQGSLFFASYEFFKRAFSLEASQFTDLCIQANGRDVREREN
ncbi:mitochondrial aspartate-glutamate transporter AGC1 isoform X1 [Phaseolus vulgaris]|uniref:mitochondrial aspartate-glutamate transporter AGC1 isoform X1 n=1 Tax=Phaseolus vulgaris TaxID=3885 RepID=UPI0035C98CEC